MMSDRKNTEALKLPSNRSFGTVFTVFFTLIGLFPLLNGHGLRVWALLIAILFLIITIIIPDKLTILNRLWTHFGALLHKIVSPVAMGIVFFGAVLPTGLILRFLGKDILRLKFDQSTTSYWIKREPPGPEPDTLKLPF